MFLEVSLSMTRRRQMELTVITVRKTRSMRGSKPISIMDEGLATLYIALAFAVMRGVLVKVVSVAKRIPMMAEQMTMKKLRVRI